jgi:hypothetical protein
MWKNDIMDRDTAWVRVEFCLAIKKEGKIIRTGQNLLNLKMTYQWKSKGRIVTTRDKHTLKL